MKNSELYVKYSYIIWPVMVGLSSIIILALVIIPQFLTYLNVKNQINQTQNKSQNLEAKASELEIINDVSTQKDLKVVFSILPMDQDVPNAMIVLQDLITRSGLDLRSTTFGSSKQVAGKNSFQLNITVSGQIQLLRDFLIQLQNSSRLFQVESISVQFQKDKGTIEADIPLSVYYQPTLGEIGPLSQPLPKFSDKNEELLSKLTTIINQANKSLNLAEASSSSVPMGKSDPFQ